MTVEQTAMFHPRCDQGGCSDPKWIGESTLSSLSFHVSLKVCYNRVEFVASCFSFFLTVGDLAQAVLNTFPDFRFFFFFMPAGPDALHMLDPFSSSCACGKRQLSFASFFFFCGLQSQTHHNCWCFLVFTEPREVCVSKPSKKQKKRHPNLASKSPCRCLTTNYSHVEDEWSLWLLIFGMMCFFFLHFLHRVSGDHAPNSSASDSLLFVSWFSIPRSTVWETCVQTCSLVQECPPELVLLLKPSLFFRSSPLPLPPSQRLNAGFFAWKMFPLCKNSVVTSRWLRSSGFFSSCQKISK